MEERNIDFNVHFLGSFSLNFHGKPIVIVKDLKQKRIQMLLILLKAGKEGVSCQNLIEMLEIKGEYFGKKLGNLRSQICKLRKDMDESGFPAGKYLPAVKGRYYFSMDYSVESDTGRMDDLDKQLKSTKVQENRDEQLRELCSIYQGEFLPSLGAEEWAVVENSHYHRIYNKYLKELCQIVQRQKNYSELLRLSTRASRFHPYDGWQELQIECLLAQEKYQEAAEVSRKANEMFEKEFGIVPFRKKAEMPVPAEGKLKLMQLMEEELEESGEISKAYFCSYLHFVDVCRVLGQIARREGKISLFLLCTLNTDGRFSSRKDNMKEDESENKTKSENEREKRRESPEPIPCLEKQMEKFGDVLSGLLRKQDAYTQYSKNQFLALLIVSGEDAIPCLRLRLEKGWKEFEQQEGLEVKLEIEPMDDFARKEVV